MERAHPELVGPRNRATLVVVAGDVLEVVWPPELEQA